MLIRHVRFVSNLRKTITHQPYASVAEKRRSHMASQDFTLQKMLKIAIATGSALRRKLPCNIHTLLLTSSSVFVKRATYRRILSRHFSMLIRTTNWIERRSHSKSAVRSTSFSVQTLNALRLFHELSQRSGKRKLPAITVELKHVSIVNDYGMKVNAKPKMMKN